MTDRGSAAPWRGSQRILLHGGSVYAPTHPFASAMLIDGGTVAWIGEDAAADVHREAADVVIDLRGALVTPGFVDAHVHTTTTGILLTGLDLTTASNGADVLARLTAHARENPGAAILGHGWDETQWETPQVPTRREIDEASRGAVVYLSRVDVHSALVSSALVEATPGCQELDGWHEAGSLSRQAHLRVRDHALSAITADHRRRAQRVTRSHAASLGIVAMHEMAGPGISSEEDLSALLDLADSEPGPVVTGYWGQLASQGGVEAVRDLGAAGAAGDLFIDGALGSRTACLHDPYLDDPASLGASYLDFGEVVDHLLATTKAGMQGGFHVIGDAAASTIIDALECVAITLGDAAVRHAGHRLEHVEMLEDSHIATLARLGVTASMQPLFDEFWGASGGMYEQRLGPKRSQRMNRLADLTRAGVPLALGSDAPVTPLGGWEAVRAAVHHHTAAQRISARAAFSAHTRGGWRSAGRHGWGTLDPGSPAHLAVWRADELEVQAPDGRIAGWSTDPRSGTPPLPVLRPGAPVPTCEMTMVAGRIIHTTGQWAGL